MTSLAWQLAKAGGWARFALLAGCTAVVSGLLLVGIAIARLPGDSGEALFGPVADPGTRGGVVFAAVLLAIPPLLLLDQAVRLGTASRERRLAALRVAGATPGEVRRLGAIEVGIPTFVGAILGLPVYWTLRAVLHASRAGVCEQVSNNNECANFGPAARDAIVPTSVSPIWWQVILVVVVVGVLGATAGFRASRQVISSPLGTTRRQTQPAPRPWGLVLLLAAALAALLGHGLDQAGLALAFVAIGLALIAIITLAPWVAFRVARRVAVRAQSATVLLAAQRIAAEPKPAGRAASAVGGIAMVAGGAAILLAELIGMGDSVGGSDPYVSLVLVAVALVVGLFIVSGSIAVHSVESLLDRKREVSFLAATGMSGDELGKVQRIETLLVSMPMSVIGFILGAGPMLILFDNWSSLGLLSAAGVALATLALVWLAAVIAVRIVRPWARRAALPGNLRTE